MWTENVTWFSNEEGKKGRIEAGQLADLVVPDRDFFACAEDEIADITADADHGRRQGRLWRRRLRQRSTTAPLPPAMPDWSPVRHLRRLCRLGRAGGRRRRLAASHARPSLRLRQRTAASMAMTTPRAWTRKLPIADLQGLLGRARLRLLGV